MVKLALLWHMHQPYYEDLASGEHILPWVRLHAIKDYWGMVAMIEEFPRVRVTFNLVPSLVVQIQAYADDRARDRHLAIGVKPATDLTPDEADWLVANGFHAPYDRMIAPHPRYAELHAARDGGGHFQESDLRDLQVWHKLAWMDPDLLAGDERLVALARKGRGYAEADKVLLRQVELEVLRKVVPAYRDAAVRGQVELSTSPFYHPILPLLCDSDMHQRARAGAERPRQRFVRPEDARAQMTRAVSHHEAMFGQRPRGLWPSEGSVSDAVVSLAVEAGLSWMATDEDILARSLAVALPRDELGHSRRPDLLYRPYRLGVEGAEVTCLFRDHVLSDRLGFTYQTWEAEAAADDFLERVREAGRRFAATTGGEVAGEEATVTVILDGENAWEHYARGGRPFLRALYQRIDEAEDIRPVTMSEAATGPARHLSSIFPGSWINADFSIWIGHEDNRRAWTQLAEARSVFEQRSATVPAAARSLAYEEVLIAEGSDWFWWYGDDHTSDHDRDFDDLFRRHLRNMYEALGAGVPEDLYRTNISTSAGLVTRLAPVGVCAIVLDGRDTSMIEWAGAAWGTLSGPVGAMHEVSNPQLISEVRVGLGLTSLCVRLSGERLARLVASGLGTLAVVVSMPDPVRIDIGGPWLAVEELVEIEVPLGALGVHAGDEVGLAFLVCDEAGMVIERLPPDGDWTLLIPGDRAAEWSV